MSSDPAMLLKEAAAAPSSPLDMDRIQGRARRARIVRAVTAGGLAIAVVVGGALGARTLLRDPEERQTFQPAPSPEPSEPSIEENSNVNWTTRVDWENRLALLYPREWFAAEESLTPRLVDPRELVTVGSFSLEYEETDCSNMPGPAFGTMTTEDAFISIQERTERGRSNDDYPKREIFVPEEVQATEGFMCLEKSGIDVYWFPFRDSGRYFYALIAVGEEADRRTASAPWFVLNNATFFPDEPFGTPDGAVNPVHYYNGHAFNVMPLVFPDGTRADMMFPPGMGLEDFSARPYAYVRLNDDESGGSSDCCGLEVGFSYGTDALFSSWAEPSDRIISVQSGATVELWESKKGRGRLLLFRFGEWRAGVSLHNEPNLSDDEITELALSLDGRITPEGFLALEARGNVEVLPGRPPIGPQLNFFSHLNRQGVLLARTDCGEAGQSDSAFTITDVEWGNGQVSWCQDGVLEIRIDYGNDRSFGQSALDALRFLNVQLGDT